MSAPAIRKQGSLVPDTEIMREPAVVDRLASLGLEPAYTSGEPFRRFIVADIAWNADLLRSTNFEPR
jgi:hypothetical protein